MTDPVIAPERLSHLIGLIYDCALDIARWPAALEAIRLELNCYNATLDLIELPTGASLTSATCNIPAAYLPLIAQGGQDVAELWGGPEVMQSLPIDEPAVMSRANPDFEAVAERNHYAQAFARPQGINDTIGLGLARDARAVGVIGLGRHVSAGPITDRELAIARLLIPHLQRTATINRIIDREAGARATFAATLDVLAVPVALIAANRRIVHANPALGRLADGGGLVRIGGDQLDAGAAANRLLDETLSAVARLPSRGRTIPVVPRDGLPGALHIVPLRRDDRDRPGASAAVFASTALTEPAGAARLVASLYNLTVRETSVFEHLIGGRSQADTADALAIGRSTVKTHLARIYNKLGVSSQAGLMAVAASLSIPVA